MTKVRTRSVTHGVAVQVGRTEDEEFLPHPGGRKVIASRLVLIVERSQRNLDLLQGALAKEGIEAIGAHSTESLEEVLSRTEVALVLIDLSGLDERVWEGCETLRTAGVPFVVISPRQSADVYRASAVHGARGVLVKPLAVRELLAVVKGLLGGD
jgi:DNA-binding response OmpR family regulator